MGERIPAMTPVDGLLVLVGWSGSRAYHVSVVGMTPKRFRIRALERLRLPRKGRWLDIGEEALVPTHAVRITGPVSATPEERNRG